MAQGGYTIVVTQAWLLAPEGAVRVGQGCSEHVRRRMRDTKSSGQMTLDATEPRSTEGVRFDAVDLLARSSNQWVPRGHAERLHLPDGLQRASLDRSVDQAQKDRRFGPQRGSLALLSDVAALGIAAILAGSLASTQVGRGSSSSNAALVHQILWLALCVPVFAMALGPSRARWLLRTTVFEQAYSAVLPLAAACTLCLASWRLLGAVGAGAPPSVDALLFTGLFGVVTVAVMRVLTDWLPTKKGPGARRVLILGSGVVAERISEQLASTRGTSVVGFVDDDPLDDSRCVGKLADLTVECERRSVDHIVVAFSKARPEEIIEALRELQGRVPITVVPRLFDVLPATATVQDLGSGLPGISVAPASLGHWPRLAKRTFDIAGAGAALVVLAPVLALVAAAIRLTSRGPVLLQQTRVGLGGKTFAMLKFRSMVDEPPSWYPEELEAFASVRGPFPKLKDDPRVTRVGRIIRRTSIDELPQLWNVLRGDMSLVGPRPFIPDDAVWIDGWAQRRYCVPPGMTGLWQVSGRNDLTFDDMCRLDQLYVSSWSVGLDMRILIKTLRAVTHGQGAY